MLRKRMLLCGPAISGEQEKPTTARDSAFTELQILAWYCTLRLGGQCARGHENQDSRDSKMGPDA